MIIGWQIFIISLSASALRVISGPIPAASPIVMPMRGSD
jgi:hypothetical protein